MFKRIHVTRVLLALFTTILSACANTRTPVPVGEIPPQVGVLAADEDYGQEVFRELAKKYTLDNDDRRIAHIRDVVDRLTAAAQVDHNPWHVYVFDDASFANAAATRGNFIFVWTGIFRDVHSEAELAAILSHELAHVLAGHTAPNPYEETTRIISGVVGDVAGQVVSAQGTYGIFADLASVLIREIIEAALINPGSQEQELEADQVGLFIMADAGYDPQSALDFWDRVKDSPGYRGGTISALSSHPSSDERLEALRALLPTAQQRYRESQSPPSRPGDQVTPSRSPGGLSRPPSRPEAAPPSTQTSSEWIWKPDSSRPSNSQTP